MDQCLSDPEDSPRRDVTKWLTYFLVGLCADIGTTTDIKHVPEEVTQVRKTVLDAIVKAFKEPSTDLDARYGRLAALGDLTHKLITSRAPGVRHDESGTHMAKVMIERGLVGVLTHATGEVDLNYPGVDKVLGSLLKALDQLSRMSIKWGKAEKDKEKARGGAGGGTGGMEVDSDEESGESEDETDGGMDVDETPDLYRNSALGM
jgi:E3 ubiquitin-protein ligase HUWE1